MSKLVSFIIANYNYGDYVLDAINSAINQTYKDVKVYVVNDGSSDNSLDNILSVSDSWEKEFTFSHFPYYSGKYNIYRHSNIVLIDIENSGASAARNVAIRQACIDNSDIFSFCILDSDDMCLPRKVEEMMRVMESSDDIGVVYADYIIDRGNYKKIEYKKPYDRNILLKECIVHSGAMIKKHYMDLVANDNKEVYDKSLHGPLSKGFIGCTEDYDLWLRLSSVCMMYHIPKPLSYVRETGRNQSLRMTQEIFDNNAEIIKTKNGL